MSDKTIKVGLMPAPNIETIRTLANKYLDEPAARIDAELGEQATAQALYDRLVANLAGRLSTFDDIVNGDLLDEVFTAVTDPVRDQAVLTMTRDEMEASLRRRWQDVSADLMQLAAGR